MGENKHRVSSCTSLTQAMGPRSSERGLSLKLQALAQARLPTESPAGFTSSRLARPPRLSKTPLRPKVRSLTFATTEAKHIRLPRVLTQARESSSRNQGKVLLFLPRRREAKLEIGRYTENTKTLAFLTLSGAKNVSTTVLGGEMSTVTPTNAGKLENKRITTSIRFQI